MFIKGDCRSWYKAEGGKCFFFPFHAQEKELVISITVENEKLLSERRKLLQQLNEEEHKKKDSCLKASLSKCRYWNYWNLLNDKSSNPDFMFVLILRVELLELENKKLGNQISQMSNQLAVLEFSLQKTELLHFAEVPLVLNCAFILYTCSMLFYVFHLFGYHKNDLWAFLIK